MKPALVPPTFAAVVLAAVPALAAEVVVDEIEAFPELLVGTWSAGGGTYAADASTVFDIGHPPVIGRLVGIEYEERDGVAVALSVTPLAIGPTEVSDGPYVIWSAPDAAEVVALCRGTVIRRAHRGLAAALPVDAPCGAEPTVRLDPAPPTVPAWDWPAPPRLLAISDLEGNYGHLTRFLRANEVIDHESRWAWGDGHLVFVGDIVDRGDQVTEIMWLVRRLEREALAAGGRLHYVLGNHETMVMAGDLRYIHPKYRFVTARLGVAYEDLYGPHSDIGRWLRTRNSVERIGNALFVHGGISPALHGSGLSLDEVNRRVRGELGEPKPATVEERAGFLIWNAQAPLWYRGYFEEHAEAFGSRPTNAQIDAILARYGVEHIVVGHTLVAAVGPIDSAGRLIGIDVEWSTAGKGQGLLVEDGALWRVDATGQREKIPE